MKLTLYAPDIEARKITRRWGEKRLSDVKTILANRELIQLEPLSHNGSIYTAIRPLGLKPTAHTRLSGNCKTFFGRNSHD